MNEAAHDDELEQPELEQPEAETELEQAETALDLEQPEANDEPADDDEPGPSDDELELEPGDDEPEAEPEQPAGPTEAEIEAQLKKLRASAERWRERVRDVMGEAADDLLPCPRCLPSVPGFIYPADVAPIGDEQRMLVMESIGLEIVPDYKPDPYRQRCSTCDGWGRVDNDSRVPNEQYKRCDDCEGHGWRDTRGAGAPPAGDQPAPGPPFPLSPVPAPADEPVDETDPWGTPVGAPYYGVLLHLRPAGWEDEVAGWKLRQEGE